jgi:hypothetical protein
LADFVVAKFSANGVKQWIKSHGTDDEDSFSAITGGPNGSLYVAGRKFGNGRYPLDDNRGHYDFVVASYSADGSRKWQRTHDGGSGGWDFFNTVALGEDGSIYAAGHTVGTDGEVSCAKGATGFAVAKFGTDGAKKWMRCHVGLGRPEPNELRSIVIGKDGSLYGVGRWQGDNPRVHGSTRKKYDFAVARFDTDDGSMS